MSLDKNVHLFTHNQANVIYYTSWLALFNGIYCLYKGYIDLGCVAFAVFSTSILYWRNPSPYSLRKYFDMTVSKLAVMYAVFRAYNSHFVLKHYSLIGFAITLYICSSYWFKRGEAWKSVISHFFVHILLNVANVMLCSTENLQTVQNNFKLFYPYGFLCLFLLSFLGIIAAYYLV